MLSELLGVVVIHHYVIRDVTSEPPCTFAPASSIDIDHIIEVKRAVALKLKVLENCFLLHAMILEVLSRIELRPMSSCGLPRHRRAGRLIEEQDMSVREHSDASNV